ncbi:PBS lyase HEAT repeat-like domain protein [Cystobacter fuscus]|uniref:PBS lyase HEAT repeat-like domain protein n=1 Tax=Cystobacter fuscus TaxID=43 RepID=A0A250JFA3_9BACT|nr:HEAT repeat domain-containing protein [Cystobacter fuscus]ATB42579.1 PBS lyase HEAT repeat-like domain protein [Cystobacter fuscus]
MRFSSHLVALLLLAFPPSVLAQADAQTSSLAKTLKQGAVVAHRVQAARLLGESDDPEAMPPLCAGLADESPEVRAAVASALEKLAEPGAVGCLEARKGEPDPQVQAALTSALKALRALQARPARLYVRLMPLEDKTGALSPELVKLTEAQARDVLRKRKLSGYRLVPEVRPGPTGGLTLAVLCLRYPGKQLLGSVDVQGSEGESGELLAALVPRVIADSATAYKWR